LRFSCLYNPGSWTDTQGRSEQKREDTRRGKPSRVQPEASTPPKRIVSDPIPALGETQHFKNRFIVHNLQLKWHNDVRNIIFNYVHQISRRRGFMYYMSQRAIRFLTDVVKEQKLQEEKANLNNSVNEDDCDNTSGLGFSAAPDD